jgi:hypothetical protein
VRTLELLGSVGVVWVLVRVELDGHPSVRLLDVRLVRVLLDSQNLVVIFSLALLEL